MTKNVAVVFSPWDWNGFGEISKTYPHVSWAAFKNPWDEPAIQVAEIPLADIQAARRKPKDVMGPALP